MRYTIDHDFHIHSSLSLCSDDPEQNALNILNCAKEQNLKTICITDHYWDERVHGASNWYIPQGFSHIEQIRPLPYDENVTFLFGCETEMDQRFNLGIPPERYDNFDFIIIPTTHMHMIDFVLSSDDALSDQRRAELWSERLDAVLNKELPFHKIGLAHLTCALLGAPTIERFLRVLEMIPSSEMEALFSRAGKLGIGVELNLSDMKLAMEYPDQILRPYKIAKQCGCKFYLGSDAHHMDEFHDRLCVFNWAVEMLDIEESDKFLLHRLKDCVNEG